MRDATRNLALAVLAALMLTAAGCLGQPTITEHQFMLEYDPPAALAGPKLDAALEIADLTAVASYGDWSMVFRPGPFQRQTYNYSRWRVPPAEMVTDFLLRDLEAGAIFRAVFGEDEASNARFRLEGSVESFLEDREGGRAARVALLITLIDLDSPRLPQRVVFQKTYAASRPMSEGGPRALAMAMSQAMRGLSAELQADVRQAAQARLGAARPQR